MISDLVFVRKKNEVIDLSNQVVCNSGDDPRDVKARLKVWAQAVALASASKYGT